MKLGLTLLCFALVIGVASASPIGDLGLGSSGFVQATLTSLNWTPDSAALPVPGPPWNADVNSATTLTFAGGPLLQQEGVLINGGLPFGSPPPPGATLFNPFLQFEVHTNLLYNLAGVDSGSSNSNCAGLSNGQSCSIDVAGSPSPVVLTVNGSSTVVSINMFGTATDGAGMSNWTGGFSATIPNISPLGILEYFCGTDNVCSASDVAAGKVLDVRSVSGSFHAAAGPAVPEPGSMSMILIGLGSLALGVIGRRKVRR